MIQKRHHPGLVLLLEQAEVDLSRQDGEGNTALLLATCAQDLDLIHCLVAYGSDINHGNKVSTSRSLMLLICFEVNIGVEQAGRTALMVSVMLQNHSMIRYFLDSHVDVNKLDQDGCTVLQLAIEHQFVNITKMLLTCPNINPNHRDKVSVANHPAPAACCLLPAGGTPFTCCLMPIALCLLFSCPYSTFYSCCLLLLLVVLLLLASPILLLFLLLLLSQLTMLLLTLFLHRNICCLIVEVLLK
jgi:ankyrin repeat protein